MNLIIACIMWLCMLICGGWMVHKSSVFYDEGFAIASFVIFIVWALFTIILSANLFA